MRLEPRRKVVHTLYQRTYLLTTKGENDEGVLERGKSFEGIVGDNENFFVDENLI